MTADRNDPFDRLARALDVALAQGEGNGDVADALRRHPDLHDLLEPMLRPHASGSDDRRGERRLGDYRLLREVGRGGMGVVYEAEDLPLRRRVALKVLAAHLTLSARQITRFRRSAAAAARLRHPGIVPIHSVGEAEGTHYVAMEFVDGVTLHAALADDSAALGTRPGQAPAARVAEIIAAIADALDHAHRAGVVHRDVKPHNVLLGRDGAPRLVDFGLAKDLDREALSESGEVAGTPHYVSPEQARGRPDLVDARSDVFSLGVVMYEMLARQRPFDGATTGAVLAAVAACAPRPLRLSAPGVPVDLQVICHKALQPEPERRYRDAAAFAADLRRFLAFEPIAARPPSPWLRARRAVQRRPARAAACGLATVLVAGIALFMRYDQQQRSRQLARERESLTQLKQALVEGRVFHEPGQERLYLQRMQDIVDRHEQLLAFEPRDRDVLREAADSFARVVDAYQHLGRAADATAAADRVVELLERSTDLGSHASRFLLGRALCQRGALMTRGGERQSGRYDLDAAIGHLTACHEADPAQPAYRGQLARAFAERAIAIGAVAGGSEQAEADARRALDLWQDLPAEHRLFEPRTLELLGWIHHQRGRGEQALQAYRRCIERGEALLAEFRGDRGLRETLATAFSRIGSWHRIRDERAEAVRHFERGLELTTALVRDFPLAQSYRLKRGMFLLDLSRSSGFDDAAMSWLQQARAVDDALRAAAADPPLVAELTRALDEREAVLTWPDDRDRARALQRRVVDSYRAALDRRWTRTDAQQLVGALGNLAGFELRGGSAARANDAVREAIALGDRVFDESAWAQHARRALFGTLLDALRDLGDHAALAEAAARYTTWAGDDRDARVRGAGAFVEAIGIAEAAADLPREQRRTVVAGYARSAVTQLERIVADGLAQPAELVERAELAPLRTFEAFRRFAATGRE